MKSFGIFEEIERLIEYIPIEYDSYNNSSNNPRFAKASIDSKFYFDDVDGVATRLGIIEVVEGKNNYNTSVSFRDILRLLNKFLKDATIEELIAAKQHYKQLKNQMNGFDQSLKSILFDFCLAGLEGDTLDAMLYLKHSFYLLGLDTRLYLLLSVIVNEQLTQDRDVRELLTLLAVITEPNNIDIHFNSNYGGFSKRYDMYIQQLQKLTPIYKESCKTATMTAKRVS